MPRAFHSVPSILVALALLTLACSGGSTPSSTSAPTATPLATEAAVDVPPLTADQRALAANVLRSDAFLTALLRDHPADVRPAASWHEGPLILGAAVTIILDPPVTLEHTWPGVVHQDGATPPYRQQQLRYRAEDVSEMQVLIDLERRQVVSISPYKARRYLPIEDTPEG